MITVTDNAVKQLHRLLKENDSSSRQGLRISVAKGGCAGMEYQIKLDAPAAGDVVIGSGGAEIYIDPESQRYLDGCSVDYMEKLADPGFKIDNPNAAKSCGCGNSFEPRETPGVDETEPVPISSRN